MPKSEVFNEDCMVGMRRFPDKYFDLLITDPPYNTTQNNWDVRIDLNLMWEGLNRIVKDGTRFPRSIFQVDYENSFFNSSFDSVQKMIHPTQKPIALFRYFIQMYSNPGDKVLDIYMGSQASRIAAADEGREYVGFELDEKYYNDGCARFEQYKAQLKLF